MPFSKDITMYPDYEQDLIMAALGSPVIIQCDTNEEATYLRSRVYALRAAAIHNWEKKQKLDKLGLDTAHLNRPIVTSAQEVMSINVRREGKTVTIGRRLGNKSLQAKVESALRARGIEPTVEKNERELEAMIQRMKANLDPDAPSNDPMADTLAQLGLSPKLPNSNDDST